MAALEIVLGPGCGRVYGIEDLVLIGRHDCCDVVLDDGAVSRTHALIARSGQGYVLRDLAASNGVFHEDVRVKFPQRLQDGDAIRVGGVVLLFHAEEHPNVLIAPAGLLGANAA